MLFSRLKHFYTYITHYASYLRLNLALCFIAVLHTHFLIHWYWIWYCTVKWNHFFLKEKIKSVLSGIFSLKLIRRTFRITADSEIFPKDSELNSISDLMNIQRRRHTLRAIRNNFYHSTYSSKWFFQGLPSEPDLWWCRAAQICRPIIKSKNTRKFTVFFFKSVDRRSGCIDRLAQTLQLRRVRSGTDFNLNWMVIHQIIKFDIY